MEKAPAKEDKTSDYTNEQENFIRFQYELDFVQMLGNPFYLERIARERTSV